jgi:hypothetical protein
MLLIIIYAALAAAGILCDLMQLFDHYINALTALYFNFSLYPYKTIANYIKRLKKRVKGLRTRFTCCSYSRPGAFCDPYDALTIYQNTGFYINFMS